MCICFCAKIIVNISIDGAVALYTVVIRKSWKENVNKTLSYVTHPQPIHKSIHDLNFPSFFVALFIVFFFGICHFVYINEITNVFLVLIAD